MALSKNVAQFMAILAGKYDDLGVAKKNVILTSTSHPQPDPSRQWSRQSRPNLALPLQPQIHPLELPRNSSNVQK